MRRHLSIAPVLLLLAIASCAPYRLAETPLQKSFVAYGQFTAVEERAADLMQDPFVDDVVKQVIQRADSVAKPAADSLLEAALAYDVARKEVLALEEGGQPVPAPILQKALIAQAKVKQLLNDVRPHIEALIKAVRAAI